MITDTEPGQTLEIRLKDWFRQDAATISLVADLHESYRDRTLWNQGEFDRQVWALVDHICTQIGGDHLVIRFPASATAEQPAPAQPGGIALDENYFVNSLLEALIKRIVPTFVIKDYADEVAAHIRPAIEAAVERARVTQGDAPGVVNAAGFKQDMGDLPTALARLRAAQDQAEKWGRRYGELSEHATKAPLDRTLDMVEFRHCLSFCAHALNALKDDWEADSSGDHADLALGMIARWLARTEAEGSADE